jgi:hypothetical protein
MRLKRLLTVFCMTFGISAVMIPATAKATDDLGQGKAIVTVLPAKNNTAPVKIRPENLHAMVNGRESSIIGWTPLRGQNGDLELVVLIDDSARAEIGLRLDDISRFIGELPADVKVAIGYMNAGRAVMKGPLSTDHSRVADQLSIPAGAAGANASPYFCLSDLAKNWPSKDNQARREVILITDGVDNYYPGYSTYDPYVQASIQDSIKAGLVVYSIYMPNRGPGNPEYKSYVGQSLLADVTGATGGYAYWDGSSRTPVSFSPYLDDIAQRLRNQYQLKFQFRSNDKPGLEHMSLKVDDRKVEVIAPQRFQVEFPAAE